MELIYLLLLHHAEVDFADDAGWTPAYTAKVYSHPEIMEFLLKHGGTLVVNVPSGDHIYSYEARFPSNEVVTVTIRTHELLATIFSRKHDNDCYDWAKVEVTGIQKPFIGGRKSINCSVWLIDTLSGLPSGWKITIESGGKVSQDEVFNGDVFNTITYNLTPLGDEIDHVIYSTAEYPGRVHSSTESWPTVHGKGTWEMLK
jgi:hypothetical protein